MSVQRQVITMPLAQGVDTKTDPKQVVAGKLLELENGVFTTTKSIQKRPGHVALGKRVTNGASSAAGVEAGAALAVYGDELLLADGDRLYSRNEAANAWTDKGPFVSVSVDKFSVVRDTRSQKAQDGATHSSGMQVYAWEDSSGGVRYAVIDGGTGQVVVPSTLLSVTGIKPRVLVIGGIFLVYFYDTSATTLKVAQLAAVNPSIAPVVSTLTGVGADDNAVNAASPNYDACVIGQNIGLVFNNGTSTGATTVRMYLGASPTTQANPQAVIAYRCRSVTVFPALSATNVWGPVIAFSTDNDTLPYTPTTRFAAYTPDLAVSLASGAIVSNFGTPYFGSMISGVQTAASGVGFEVYYATNTSVVKVVFDASYARTVTSSWMVACRPFAKAFAIDGKAYVPLVYESPLQTTYFVCASDREVVAKALYGTAGSASYAYGNPSAAGGNWSMPIAASTTMLGPTSVRVACLEQANLTGTGLTTTTGVSALTFDFSDATHSYASAPLGGSLLFSGGFPQMYDGIDVVEHGFLLYPEAGTVTATAQGSGGSLSVGTYHYTACYEWIDHQNRVHRSRPNEGVTVTTVNNDSVEVVIPYLKVTNKRGDRPVQIVVYRTLKDGKGFHRITSLTSPTLNDPALSVLQITDTLSDAVVATYPLLYCQFLQEAAEGIPAELPNDPAPPAKLVELHRNRVWVVDSTNPLQVWYSKEASPDAPVEFSDANVKQVDPRGGAITALASLDDKLLLFKRDHIFYVLGQGPTNTGTNNDLSDAILVTTDCGCIDPRSIVSTPVGVMFQSAKGLYLIDRSLQVQYVGAPVEAYNGETITSATLVATNNQVRFTLESGEALVYDYFVQQWGTFTNLNAVDSVVWLGSTTLLRANGQVLRETPGVFTDAGSPVKLKLVTSWLSFANLQGFQRVRRALVLGAWKSAHQLKIGVCVDFDDTVIQQVIVEPTSPTMYGDAGAYGVGSSYGGVFDLYQWRVDLERQKTQAVKFIIEDLPAATAGEGMSLASLAFEVGAKQGTAKVPASRIVG